VAPDEFASIVGIRFAEWLEETNNESSQPTDNPSDLKRLAIHVLAKMRIVTLLEQGKPKQWAVRLLFANVSDIATRLQCEQELAKFWVD